MLMELNLDALKLFDSGQFATMFEDAMAAATKDCVARAGDTAARKVIIKFEMVPVRDQQAACDAVNVDVSVVCKMPPHWTRPVVCKPRVNGSLMFNEVCPENPEQLSFQDIDDSTEKQGENAHVDD